MAVLFGPSLALLSMGLVLIAQVAFLGAGTFGTLGANFLILGVFAAYSGYAVFHWLGGSRSSGFHRSQFLVFAASVIASITASSVFAFCSSEMGLAQSSFLTFLPGYLNWAYTLFSLLFVWASVITTAVRFVCPGSFLSPASAYWPFSSCHLAAIKSTD